MVGSGFLLPVLVRMITSGDEARRDGMSWVKLLLEGGIDCDWSRVA